MAVTKKAAIKSITKAASAAKKATTRKAVATKKARAQKQAVKPIRLKSIAQRQTKTKILQAIAEETGLSRKQVGDVFASLGDLIQRHMQRRGSGEFAIPDTGVKVRRVKRPARKSRMGRNPATGEPIKIAAKPATTVIRVTALKALKDTLN